MPALGKASLELQSHENSKFQSAVNRYKQPPNDLIVHDSPGMSFVATQLLKQQTYSLPIAWHCEMQTMPCCPEIPKKTMAVIVLLCTLVFNFNFVVGCPVIAIVFFLFNAVHCCDINLSQMMHHFMMPCAQKIAHNTTADEFDSFAFACGTCSLPMFMQPL